MNLKQPGSVPAWELDEGKSFIWKGEMYTIIDREEGDGDHIKVKDKLGLEQNFNPYTYVLPVKE